RLAAPNRRLFRLLGLLDPPVFSVADVVRLAGFCPVDGEDLVEDLVEARLAHPGPGRASLGHPPGPGWGPGDPGAGPTYHLDELTWLFARELVVAEESAEERSSALARLGRPGTGGGSGGPGCSGDGGPVDRDQVRPVGPPAL
ncbi:MAG TPA: hypothetical protein VGD43_05920, partial [Micromonospora sp.]